MIMKNGIQTVSLGSKVFWKFIRMTDTQSFCGKKRFPEQLNKLSTAQRLCIYPGVPNPHMNWNQNSRSSYWKAVGLLVENCCK